MKQGIVENDIYTCNVYKLGQTKIYVIPDAIVASWFVKWSVFHKMCIEWKIDCQ